MWRNVWAFLYFHIFIKYIYKCKYYIESKFISENNNNNNNKIKIIGIMTVMKLMAFTLQRGYDKIKNVEYL